MELSWLSKGVTSISPRNGQKTAVDVYGDGLINDMTFAFNNSAVLEMSIDATNFARRSSAILRIRRFWSNNRAFFNVFPNSNPRPLQSPKYCDTTNFAELIKFLTESRPTQDLDNIFSMISELKKQ